MSDRLFEIRKRKAEEVTRDKEMLVKVLRQRMRWHLQQADRAESAGDEMRKKCHQDLFLDDEILLYDASEDYEKFRKIYGSKYGIEMPDVDFSAEEGGL